MSMLRTLSTGAAALVLSAGIASAATVDINVDFIGAGEGNIAANIASGLTARTIFLGSSPIVATDNFSTLTACPDAGGCAASDGTTPLSTSVGDFNSITPPVGGGTTSVDPKGEVVIKERPSSSPAGGRFSVDNPDGTGKWLDSNDNKGIVWNIPGSAGFEFNKLAFFLTDLNDAGNLLFEIIADGVVTEKTVGITGPGTSTWNASLHLVTMSFSAIVGGAGDVIISLKNDSSADDGFGVTGVVAAIPLPAPAFLLLGGMGVFGGMAAMRRRKEKKAA